MQIRPQNVSLWTIPMLTASVAGLFCITSSVLTAVPARADVLLQTATPGDSATFGTDIDSSQYLCARFQTSQSFQLTNVQINVRTVPGASAGNGLLFAAIVPLSSLTAFPNEGDGALIADDNPMEFHTFTAPNDTSALVTIPFSASLSAGTYAVVFGSGEFGATGVGRTPPNGTEIGTPSYFFKSGSGFINGGFVRTTFIVNGTPGTVIVPEPGSLTLVGICALTLMGTIARRAKPLNLRS